MQLHLRGITAVRTRNVSRARLLLVLGFPMAMTQAENIDPANDSSQYSYGENVGWINAEPLGNGGPGVQVTDFSLTGWMWAENIGWISLSCENTSSCAAAQYAVRNTCAGVLSGYAWSENAGWINFDPSTSDVTVDPVSGNFNGYAWAENVGWISLSCENTSTCGAAPYKVRTSWTPSGAAPAGTPTLMLGRSGSNTVLLSSVTPAAPAYDLVRGDLIQLRITGGDFTLATQGCLAENHIFTSRLFSSVPPVGQGFWFLTRTVNCAGGGTYNTGVPSQVGSRDSEIASSANSCLP